MPLKCNDDTLGDFELRGESFFNPSQDLSGTLVVYSTQSLSSHFRQMPTEVATEEKLNGAFVANDRAVVH